MKSPISYFLISGIIIVLLFTGLFIWRNKNTQGIPHQNAKSYATPISAKYIPKNADLVFHWKINPKNLPNYLENIQGNRNITNKKIRLIRDSSFKLISLNFEKDISKWVGEYGSFAVFDTNNQALNNWLMVLEISKNLNSEETLESISSENTFDNLNLKKPKIISKKINSNQSIYFSKDKEYILIASNPKLIKSSINKLEINILNTKENYKDIQLKDNLNDGILLLEMNPNKIFNIIGQEKDLFEFNKANKLITSINIDKKKLYIEGILSFDIKTQNPGNGLSYDLIDQEKLLKSFEDYILIDNPKQYFETDSHHPFQRLVASVIQKSITTDYSNLFKVILQNTKGNLIWLNNKGWLAVTNKSDTNKEEIDNILYKGNFLNSYLEFKNKNLEVWSKLSTVNNEKIEIKDSIESIIQDNEDVYLWSQNLSAISDFGDNIYLSNFINSKNIEDEQNDFNEIIKIHLGKEKTEVFLNNFYPYILLRAMLGNKLDFPQEINMSLETPKVNYPNFFKFKINSKSNS